MKAMVYQHHRFNVSALLPVGPLMLEMAPVVGADPPVLLDGYFSVSGLVSSEMSEALVAIGADGDVLAILRGTVTWLSASTTCLVACRLWLNT